CGDASAVTACSQALWAPARWEWASLTALTATRKLRFPSWAWEKRFPSGSSEKRSEKLRNVATDSIPECRSETRLLPVCDAAGAAGVWGRSAIEQRQRLGLAQ